MVNRQPLEKGAVLSDEYQIQGVLGQGGFGITYDARDMRLDTRRAIKEYFPYEMSRREGATQITPYSGIHNDQFVWGRSRFVDEGKLIARFSHTGIVKVIRMFEENNTAYMVLDFVEGETLEKWAQRHPTPSPEIVMPLVSRLLDALETIHAANILHRDISPDNVMMRPSSDPVYIDFGAARSDLGSRTKTFVMIREGYSPSEQHSGQVTLQGAWTDIYSLAATLYRVVTGEVPPSGIARSAGETLTPSTELAANRYPAPFLAAIDSALRMHIRERPQTVAEWRQMIFTDPVTAAAPRSPWSEPTPATGRPPAPSPSPSVSEPGFLRRMFARPSLPGGDAPSAAVTSRPEDEAATALADEEHNRREQAADAAAWAEAQAIDTIVAYRAYQARFPSGRHVTESGARLTKRSDNRMIRTLQGPPGAVHSLSVSADGKSLLSGGADGHVRLWSLSDGSVRTFAKPHARAVRVVSFLPDANFAVSAGDDRTARLWTISNGGLARSFDRHDSEVLSLAITTDGLGLITGTRLRSVTGWDLNSGRLLSTFDHHNAAVTAIATVPDGQHILTGGQDRVLRLHTMPSLAMLRPLGVLEQGIVSVAVTPDGAQAATAGAGGVIQLWDLHAASLPDGRPPASRLTLRGHDDTVRALAITDNGRAMVSAGRDGTLRAWKVGTGAALATIKAHPDPIHALALDRPNGIAITAGASGSICVWDLSDLLKQP